MHSARAARGYYPTFQLTGARDLQVWYFAFRDVTVPGLVWRPYGAVRRMFGSAELFSEAGVTAAILGAPDRPVPVRTFFGAGAAEFRVASLHAFDLDLIDEPTSEEGALTFP